MISTASERTVRRPERSRAPKVRPVTGIRRSANISPTLGAYVLAGGCTRQKRRSSGYAPLDRVRERVIGGSVGWADPHVFACGRQEASLELPGAVDVVVEQLAQAAQRCACSPRPGPRHRSPSGQSGLSPRNAGRSSRSAFMRSSSLRAWRAWSLVNTMSVSGPATGTTARKIARTSRRSGRPGGTTRPSARWDSCQRRAGASVSRKCCIRGSILAIPLVGTRTR